MAKKKSEKKKRIDLSVNSNFYMLLEMIFSGKLRSCEIIKKISNNVLLKKKTTFFLTSIIVH